MNTLYSTPAAVLRRVSPGARALFACGALALFGGCASEPESHVVSAPPPPAPAVVPPGASNTTVTTQTTSAPNGMPAAAPATTVTTTQAPPAAQAEVVLAQPGPDYKWVPGFWTWRNSQYEWMAGHWEVPPHADSTWMAPHWEPTNGGYRFYEGYWN